MAVKLRLKRVGRRHVACFRLSAMDSRAPRDGRALEELGLYDPCAKAAEKQVVFNAERIRFWLGQGATPSETVRRLLVKSGIAK